MVRLKSKSNHPLKDTVEFWKWASEEFEVMPEDEVKLVEEVKFNKELVKFYETEIGVLANALSEKRSDISEILSDLLTGVRVRRLIFPRGNLNGLPRILKLSGGL